MYMSMYLPEPLVFEWDEGNREKNWLKHRLTTKEIEEVFFDENKKQYKDQVHSTEEQRWILIGSTTHEKLLFIVYTIRHRSVRVISARILNKKERIYYEKAT